MKPNRFWIEIVALGTAVVCAAGLGIATLRTPAGAVPGQRATQVEAASSIPQQAYEGVVTCSRCGAKHSAEVGETARECARQCVHGGATFALVNGDKTYLLDGDLDLLRRAAGRRSRILGVVHGNTIKVSAVAAQT